MKHGMNSKLSEQKMKNCAKDMSNLKTTIRRHESNLNSRKKAWKTKYSKQPEHSKNYSSNFNKSNHKMQVQPLEMK